MATPNAFAPQAPLVSLTLDQTREALVEVEKLLGEPANNQLLEGAKTAGGQDPMMLMMMVMPVAVQILTPVLQKYGFPCDQAGGMQFLAAMGAHKEDPAVVTKATEIKSKFIPPQLAAMAAMFMGGGAPGMPMPPPSF
mmetsp:Transcript_27234/g.37565  ORF Transcript_27234/g.37565 Transcript_27234/m.37565 type:complete len:138 (+) Transcript_27234:136-549(+)|eukprot:CAMPEP_0196580426 /NCGR_PEP_ID=MMETSP1081-20130531/28621_1 /TAXON_ID=36882 /ORGANISM="Pyramimonas amylifera, Strain CCMP720" /LENGTH=137 /DNA_ID=CAMNT_0041900287 /DNA_START=136 /DNA_END=549 /DNA_ORIENTATION=+